MSSSHCPSSDACLAGTFVGCMPNNFVFVNAGSRLGELRSLSDLYDIQLLLIGEILSSFPRPHYASAVQCAAASRSRSLQCESKGQLQPSTLCAPYRMWCRSGIAACTMASCTHKEGSSAAGQLQEVIKYDQQVLQGDRCTAVFPECHRQGGQLCCIFRMGSVSLLS